MLTHCGDRFMLELKKEQVAQFVQKVSEMAKAAGCQVMYLTGCSHQLRGRLQVQEAAYLCCAKYSTGKG